MTSKLVCPNCGSDKRYLICQVKKASPFSERKGHTIGNRYMCAKCGFRYTEASTKKETTDLKCLKSYRKKWHGGKGGRK
jgi:C4-type Zn-finger protein